MPAPSSTPTVGLRTWRRTDADAATPLAERIAETTHTGDASTAIAKADFVTVPRQTGDHEGYDDAYAEAVAAALAERFGFAGGRRVSTSGRSHVFEREAIQSGLSVDLGLPSMITGGTIRLASSGDGVLGRVPALSSR